MKTIKEKFVAAFKRETVLCVAVLLAVFSAFLVPPDSGYADYVDFRTLAILFCLMAVMAGVRELRVFDAIGQKLLMKTKRNRQLVMVLLALPFFSSMIITNDVALITFVPFTIIVLGMLGEEEKKKYLIPLVAMQTVAANLGSMLTPIGNPQNLYLYGLAGTSLGDFLLIMAPYTSLALLLLFIGAFFLAKNQEVSVEFPTEARIENRKRLLLYLLLFIASILTVARLIPVWIPFGLTVALLFFFDRKVIYMVDYALLGTFVGFFVFIGNLGRLPAFSEMLNNMVEGHEVLTAVFASQVVSNVPAALLLSGFTKHYEALIIGCNLGGLGTLIASMASLISFKYIAREDRRLRGKYLLYFTAINVVFLGLLTVLYKSL